MLASGWLKAQAVATVAAIGAAVGIVATSSSATAVPQAGGLALALIQRAPQSLSAYASLKETLTIQVRASGRSVRIVAHGLVAPDGRNGTFSYDLPAGLPSYDLEFVDGVAYAPLPVEKRPLAMGRPYVALDMSGMSNPQINPGNASTLLTLLAGAHGSVADRGAATVGGVPTRRYHLMVDVQEAYGRIPANLRPPAAGVQALGATMPMDVWLDRDGVLRQLESDVHAQGADVTFTLKVRGSSTALHVAAPPAGDVFRAADAQQFSAILAGR